MDHTTTVLLQVIRQLDAHRTTLTSLSAADRAPLSDLDSAIGRDLYKAYRAGSGDGRVQIVENLFRDVPGARERVSALIATPDGRDLLASLVCKPLKDSLDNGAV